MGLIEHMPRRMLDLHNVGGVSQDAEIGGSGQGTFVSPADGLGRAFVSWDSDAALLELTETSDATPAVAETHALNAGAAPVTESGGGLSAPLYFPVREGWSYKFTPSAAITDCKRLVVDVIVQ